MDRDGQKIQRRAVSTVSGLKGNIYEDKLRELEMLTLEERRHQADMAQTFKIIRGVDMVNCVSWFQMVGQAGRATRSTDDTLNVRPKAARNKTGKLEQNSQPCEKCKKSVFKRSYKNQRAGCSSLEEKDLKARWRDGAQHEEDTPREVPAGLLGVQHQVSK
jgi:hypothetical protein